MQNPEKIFHIFYYFPIFQLPSAELFLWRASLLLLLHLPHMSKFEPPLAPFEYINLKEIYSWYVTGGWNIYIRMNCFWWYKLNWVQDWLPISHWICHRRFRLRICSNCTFFFFWLVILYLLFELLCFFLLLLESKWEK